MLRNVCNGLNRLSSHLRCFQTAAETFGFEQFGVPIDLCGNRKQSTKMAHQTLQMSVCVYINVISLAIFQFDFSKVTKKLVRFSIQLSLKRGREY